MVWPHYGKALLSTDIEEDAARKLKAIPTGIYQGCMGDWNKQFFMHVVSDVSYFNSNKAKFAEI